MAARSNRGIALVSVLWITGLLAVMAALGAYNWRRVAPALEGADGARRLQKSAGAELLLAVLILAVTAVLVATPTPGSG